MRVVCLSVCVSGYLLFWLMFTVLGFRELTLANSTTHNNQSAASICTYAINHSITDIINNENMLQNNVRVKVE